MFVYSVIMRIYSRVLLLMLFLTTAISCSRRISQHRAIAELLMQHELSMKSHFNLDATTLVRENMEPFISVSGGRVDSSMRADAEAMFRGYFEGAKYMVYEDVRDPIVRVSKDGSMAWMITQNLVVRKKKVKDKEVEEKFTYAGIMTYRKVNGKWMREANVSTFRQ